MVVMIALLPLQSWAVAAVATHMAVFAAEQSAVAGVADSSARPAESSVAAMPNCLGHAPAGAVLQAGSTHHGAKHDVVDGATMSTAETCSACQVCHSVALAPLSSVVFLAGSSPPQPLVAATSFTSATPALGQKPPIS